MKKIFILSIITGFMLFLSGCSTSCNTDNDCAPVEHETKLTVNTEIKKHFVPADQYGRIGRGEDFTGYYYYLTYPEFGIKLHFEDDFSVYFDQKTELDQIFKLDREVKAQHGRINFYQDINYIRPFIQAFEKDENISLLETIKKDHPNIAKNNCNMMTGSQTGAWEKKHFSGDNMEIIDLDMSTDSACNSIFPKYEAMSLGFVMDHRFPNRYYMFYYVQGCAPSCDMPKLEIIPLPNEKVLDNQVLDSQNTYDFMASFLEQNLAWTNNPDGKSFCNYNTLGQEGDKTYLRALCQEFYVQDQKLVCPDRQTREDCFVSKTRKECELCDLQDMPAYLAQGGGVSIPLILTKTGNTYDMRQPRDGSYYSKDIKSNFPSHIDVFSHDHSNLLSQNLQNATAFFAVKPKFDISEQTTQSCQSYADCDDLPFDYAARSDCPHTVSCIQNQCAIGCYDFRDYVDMPELKN